MPTRVSICFLLLTLSMFLLALTPAADLEEIAAQSTTVVLEPRQQEMLVAGTPHGPVAIDGDANFSDTALLEGWEGAGSPEDPFIIDGLDIDLGGESGSCIMISNTRVSFTISNCNLKGASSSYEAGIYLENVNNGEIINNTCNGNSYGISLYYSDSNSVANNNCSDNRIGFYLDNSDANTVVNNICYVPHSMGGPSWIGIGIGLFLNNSDSNAMEDNTCIGTGIGIYLLHSDSNTVIDDICLSNTEYGISLRHSHDNTVFDNTCTDNRIGLFLNNSDSNAVEDNTCTENGSGLFLEGSFFNTVENNTCTNNVFGISLRHSHNNIVFDNTCFSNGESGIYLEGSNSNTVSNNICNNNRIGISLYLSDNNTVTYNSCFNNTEHDIYLDDSDSNTVVNNITTGFNIGLLLLGGVFLSFWVGFVESGSVGSIAFTVTQRTKYRLIFWFHMRRVSQDEIIVPIRYRLASWLYTRGSIKHMVIDENLEADSSDQ